MNMKVQPDPACAETPSWCEVSSEVIANNLDLALDLLPDKASFCAVLKSDAYGHGIGSVMPAIMARGLTHVAITTNAEARAVRASGFCGTLLRLRAASAAEMQGALDHQVQEQISSLDAARTLRQISATGRQTQGWHLALNAGGMARDGLELSTPQARAECDAIMALISDGLVGICSHFPSNAPQDLAESSRRFESDVDWVLSRYNLPRSHVTVHAGSSLTLAANARFKTDMFRCGAILYGILRPDLGFRPSMTLKARVVSLGSYPRGSTVGYDRAVRLSDDRRLANISIGYSNGFRRNFFGRSSVLIRGRKVPVVGKVSMNTISADVTSIPEVSPGDEVVVFGGQSNQAITCADMERQSDTIMADLFSDWGQCNPRFTT